LVGHDERKVIRGAQVRDAQWANPARDAQQVGHGQIIHDERMGVHGKVGQGKRRAADHDEQKAIRGAQCRDVQLAVHVSGVQLVRRG